VSGKPRQAASSGRSGALPNSFPANTPDAAGHGQGVLLAAGHLAEVLSLGVGASRESGRLHSASENCQLGNLYRPGLSCGLTCNAGGSGRILGSLRAADGKGVVRMEDRVDTDIDDVWSALTDPSRLARWYGKIEGDLYLGCEYRARLFASGWEGTGRVTLVLRR
jgi:hypothetical protein